MSAIPIPKTAPFRDEEIELLNRVVGPASPTQRAWLAGFLAGVEASSAAPQPAAPPLPAEPLTIVYASESGNSEKLAGDIAKAARKNGLKPTLIDMADLDVASLASSSRLVVIAATWGEGEPPARAARAYAELMGEAAPRLDGVEFGVLALGDTAYVEFCAVGKALDERLAALGGKRVVDRVDCDLDFAAPAADWIGRAVKALAPADADRGTVIEVDFGKPGAAAKPEIVEAEITEHINLNSSRSDKETSIWRSPSTAPRRPTSRATRSTSMPRTIRPRSTSCSRLPACPDDKRCAPNSSSRATSTRCRSRPWRPMPSDRPSVRQGADRKRRGARVDRRPATDRSDRPFPHRADGRASARADAAAGAARLFDRVVAPRGRRGSASADFRGALRQPRPRPQGRRLELRRRAAQEAAAGCASSSAQQAFRAAGARPRHHHGRPRHRRGAVPRLRAGAPRHRGQGPQLAVLRRPPFHPRLPLPARMAGRAQGRRAHAHGRRVLARPAGEGLCPGPHLGAAAAI